MASNKDKCIGFKMCVYICPFGAMDFDRVRRIAVTCDLCGGDPICVKFCPTGALCYLRSEELSMKLRADKVGRFLDARSAHSEEREQVIYKP